MNVTSSTPVDGVTGKQVLGLAAERHVAIFAIPVGVGAGRDGAGLAAPHLFPCLRESSGATQRKGGARITTMCAVMLTATAI